MDRSDQHYLQFLKLREGICVRARCIREGIEIREGVDYVRIIIIGVMLVKDLKEEIIDEFYVEKVVFQSLKCPYSFPFNFLLLVSFFILLVLLHLLDLKCRLLVSWLLFLLSLQTRSWLNYSYLIKY